VVWGNLLVDACGWGYRLGSFCDEARCIFEYCTWKECLEVSEYFVLEHLEKYSR
jgi:hypothetical protein